MKNNLPLVAAGIALIAALARETRKGRTSYAITNEKVYIVIK